MSMPVIPVSHFFIIICTCLYHSFLPLYHSPFPLSPLPTKHTHRYTATLTFTYSSSGLFENEYQRSYRCPEEDISLENTNTSLLNVTDVKLELKEWQVQAFEFRNNENTFGNGALICCSGGLSHDLFHNSDWLISRPLLSTVRECSAFAKRDIKLPIIVACVLGVLLISVVVVYILSRVRRRRLVSYEALN